MEMESKKTKSEFRRKQQKKQKRWILLLGMLSAILFLTACSQGENSDKSSGKTAQTEQTQAPVWKDMKADHSMKLRYATQFSVDEYDGGYSLVTIAGKQKFLVVPENQPVPKDMDSSVQVLKQPLNQIYLSATSAMDFFRALDGIDAVTLSGTAQDGWYIKEAQDAMKAGTMQYAGKYSAPDYEKILEQGCDLALESTMIYHTPQVQEKLESFGIPVLVEHSSYESHPLGRVEWIKLYGVLLGKEKEAEQYFDRQITKLEETLKDEQKETGKTVAFFYISSNGYVNVRKSGDYVAKMIELAGGKYILEDLTNDNALSTMNMQMEDFYAKAKDADYLVYNSTIDGELETMSDLIEKSSLLKDFKAVKNGNVWCTGKNLFQETTGLSTMIGDLHKMLLDDGSLEKLTYMHKLKT